MGEFSRRCVLGAVVSALALGSMSAAQPGAGAAPSTRPAGGGAGGGIQQIGQAMVRELRGIEGCLGAEAGQFSGGRFVIIAWFKDKAAALRWYDHPMHRRMQAGAGMAQADPGDRKVPPMDGIPDNVPIMAVATMTFGGPPIEGSQIPFSGISIELYSPLRDSLRVGSGFAPDGFFGNPRPDGDSKPPAPAAK